MATIIPIVWGQHLDEFVAALNANFTALNDELAAIPVGGGGGGGGGGVFQFSQLGTGSWHNLPTIYDAFLRFSADAGATWSAAVRFVGAAAVASTVATLTYNPAVAVDMTASRIFKITPAGNIAWSATNISDGLECLIRIMPQENATTFTFPAEWVFMGEPPLSLPAGKWGTLYLHGCGTNATDVLAAWDQQK
jgi:hypothetical protein